MMADPCIHVRAARAELANAAKRTFLHDTLAGLLDEIERLESALRKISSPTQTLNLLWWQKEARAALAETSSNASEKNDG
jgi:hypothetical protein